jgi:hypothetical protein
LKTILETLRTRDIFKSATIVLFRTEKSVHPRLHADDARIATAYVKTIRIFLVATLALLGEVECFSQSIVWNGNGDGTSWSNRQNWTGLQVPGPANNVVITNGAGTNVVISSAVSVESILCSKALTISSGSLTVTAGASSLQGTLTIASGATLSVSGATLTSSGSVDITNANLYVSGGGTLSLPGVVNCNDGSGGSPVWQASGAGSGLALTGLTNVAGPYSFNTDNALLVQALAGGLVNLGGLISISGVVQVESGGNGSEVNLSALQVFDGTNDNNISQLQPSSGGTILAGQLGSLTGVTVVLGSGTLNLNAVTNLGGSTLTVTNGSMTLSKVVDIDGANLYVNNGATLSLPGVVNCNDGSGGSPVWQASGAGSGLALTGLTNVAGPYSFNTDNALLIQALTGGLVNLGGLISISGVVQVESDGNGSEVNLSALQVFDGTNDNNISQLQPSSGGTILAGQLGSLTGVTLVLGSGTLNLNAVTNLSGSTLTVTNGAVTLSAVVDIDGVNLYVNNGATLSLPGVVHCNDGSGGSQAWQASGLGSVLALTGLTNVAGLYSFDTGDALLIQALTGGLVNLGGLISISGVVQAEAGGAGSEVNLSALRVFDGTNDNNISQLQPSSGGTILAGQLGSLTGVTLVLGSGTLNLNAVTNLSGSTLTVTNGAVTLSAVVDIDGVNLYVNNGATLSLPGVLNCNDGSGGYQVWQASGSGSVLALTGLTNVAGPYSFDTGDALLIQALAGGLVNLGGLISISGVVQAEAGGAGSEVNLSALRVFDGTNDNNVSQLQPSSGGTILAGQLGSLTGVTVVLGSGTLNLNAVTNLSGSTLMVTNGSVTLGNVVDVDDASLYVSGGATLSLTGVMSFQAGCANILWQASGADSVLGLPGLTNLQGSTCGDTLNIQALTGGKVNLDNLQTIANDSVGFLSDDAGSVINLSSLSAFVLQNGQGSLTAENGGTILFNNQFLLLANVAINIPAGNPILPATLVASSALTLYGQAWNSYQVEEWNMLAPRSPVTVLLVPLTNSFETIAATPAPNIAFLVTDFVANPPILQLALTPDSEVQLVLYAASNETYQIQITTNLGGKITWTNGSSVVMTNSFRIFPPTLPAQPALFYRAEQQ